jgi:hypothetical protein
VIAQEHAAKLLDDVLFARVVECVDLAKLLGVELDLWAAICEQTESEATARENAKLLISRALTRLADSDERYAPIQPFGMDCPDCDDEIRESRRRH